MNPEVITNMARIKQFIDENAERVKEADDSFEDLKRLKIIFALKAFAMCAAMDSKVDATKVKDLLNTDEGNALLVALIMIIQDHVHVDPVGPIN